MKVEEKNLIRMGSAEKLLSSRGLMASGVYQVKITEFGNYFELHGSIRLAKDAELETFLAEWLEPVYFQDANGYGKVKYLH